MQNEKILRQLNDMRDRQQIQNLVQTLASAIDRNDRERMLSCYHPGAIDDHGEYSGPVEGFVEWIDMLYRERLLAMSHQISNHRIELHDDMAKGEAYVSVFMAGRPMGDQRMQMIGIGRYLDRYERRNGSWRIAHRLVLTDWQQIQMLPTESDDGLITELHMGLPSRDDPSYAHFASP